MTSLPHSANLEEDTTRLLQTAVAALDAGAAAKLQEMLDRRPAITQYRTEVGDGGYFASATLLHHIAGNPIRYPLPANILEVAAIVLQHGADPNALCGVPGNSYSTIGLLLTSKQASEAGVAVALIDLLLAAGAKDEVFTDADVLSKPLWNGGRATAEALVGRGVAMDARHAAALGRLDRLQEILDGAPMERRILEEALVYASMQNEWEAVRLLVTRGAKGDVNASPGGQSSALHNAAWRGNTDIVNLLLEHGADACVRDNQYQASPAGWAEHGGHAELAALLRSREGG
ncbi:hypothetical protein CCAX7_41430 [Capsulimonas corticalis]|uniref:Uncharacterized protein n=1 Tax=Capsulimonas corticalis TaxID=2219043 RepID=A0A402CY33_9BACT|nr:ankyrin repeat domain-containing protein [Capsulimonas corticalis]BDI32092.1 hypothetical protein CCAX7_41430 [Capsulimonas corticalis]